VNGAEQLRRMAAEMDELVIRREFSAAADCAARLGEWVRSAVSKESPPESYALLAESERAIETARRKMCVARARISDELLRLERSAEYFAPGRAGVHSWSVEA
jgi:hypothetical protein